MDTKKINLKSYFVTLLLVGLIIFSFWKIEFKLDSFFSEDSLNIILKFVNEFFPPNLENIFLYKVLLASWETFAMSVVSTFFAAFLGLFLAIMSISFDVGKLNFYSNFSSILLNILRSIPELIWAVLLIISAGLGPFSGTLALMIHTTGVLGRLLVEAIENLDNEPSEVLSAQGASRIQIFFYVTLIQLLPQMVSYILYRWENNIRVAAVLGVVGAGGLGQMLNFNLSLFLMDKTCTIILAMIFLVCIVDFISSYTRRGLTKA